MHIFKRKHPHSYFRLKQINKVIRYLTLSDIMVISGFGMILPIFAVYITKSIEGGTVEVAGIATAIYLFTKSLGQIPIASIIDRIKGERDDFWAMFIGSVFFSLIPLLYIFAKTPMSLYLVQFIYGLAAAATVPSWYAIFTRHIDKNHEGVEWGAYQTFVDLGSAIAAFIGGFIAYRFGFAPLFIIVSLIILTGAIFLLSVYKSMTPGKNNAKKRRKKHS